MEKEELYNQAKNAYYNGEPIMSDLEFDELEKELGLENKGYIGTHHQKSYTIPHPFLMGSLSKIQIKLEKDNTIYYPKYVSAIRKYLDKSYSKIKPEFKDNWYFETTPKYDGCSFECVIDSNGNLVSVSTRGDGEFGKDIKPWFEQEYKTNIEPKLSNYFASNFDTQDMFFMKHFVIRGECLVNKYLFKEKYLGKFKMPRSFVAGCLGQDWEGTPEQIEMRNDLSWVCYDYRETYENGVIVENDYSGYQDEKMQKYLDTYSFENFPGIKPRADEGSIKIYRFNALDNFHLIYQYWENYRKNCEFELDGFVIKPGALYRLQDGNRTRQEDCVAIKFTPEIVESEIIDIEWNVGKDGEYYPTGILTTTLIGGKNVDRVSLANYSKVVEKAMGIGAKVKISLAGDIIPFVIDVVEPSTNINTPKDTYIEYNNGCGHLMKIMTADDERFISFINSVNMLKIDGVGEKVAEKLYNIIPTDNIIEYMCSDSYINEIRETLGESKSTNNIINAIEERKKILSLYDIILSMGIENCGEKNSMWLAKKISGLNPDTKGIPTTLINLNNSYYPKINQYMSKLNIGYIKEETNIGDDVKKVILTGSPKEAGYSTKGEFLKQHPEYVETTKWDECDILITDDINSTSSKMKKAQAKGIEIKTYFDF